MTPVKKNLEQIETKDDDEKETKFEGQLTQLEATFRLDKVFILIDYLFVFLILILD